MFESVRRQPGGQLYGLLADAMPNPQGSYRGNVLPVIRMPDGSMEPAVPEMLRSGLLGMAEWFDAGKAAGEGRQWGISGEATLSLPASSAIAGAATAPRGVLASGASRPYRVFQGRSRRGLTDFFNPDGNSWGSTSRETAEQFAGKSELSKYYPSYPGEVYELEFDLKNPMEISYRDVLWDRQKELAKIAEAKAKGHDGLKIKFNDEKTDYVAFYPEQVKRVDDALIRLTDDAARKLSPEERMNIAQRNAALPVEKGGLGLPPDNTPEMRARAMGFDTDAYHGTRSDFDEFERGDIGFHFGSEEQASKRLADTRRAQGVEGEAVLPVKLKYKNPVELPDVGEWNDPAVVSDRLKDTNWGNSNWQRRGLLDDIADDARSIQNEFYDRDEFLESPEASGFLDDIRMEIEDGADAVRYRNEVENKFGDQSGLTRSAQKRFDDLNREYHELRKAIASRRPPPPDDPAELDSWLKAPAPEPTKEEARRLEELLAAKNRLLDTETNDPFSTIIMDPRNIRSRFAAFDPARADSADLLASNPAPAGLLGLFGMAEEDRPKRSKRSKRGQMKRKAR